jgi:hypothetical protein
MTQIIKKFLASDAVDGSKIKLQNGEALRARNFADSADIDLIKLDASNDVIFPSTPKVGTDALVKQSDLSAAIQGLKPKAAARAATTANLVALSGLLIVDTVQLVDGDRVLVKDQTATEENGIYVAHSGAWVRAVDFDSISPINEIQNAYLAIAAGSQAGRSYVCSSNPTVVGVDPIVFVFFNAVSGIVAGNGIDVLGATISVKLDGSTLAVSASGTKIATSGVSATEIAANAVTAVKLNADVAGAALGLNGTTNALDVKVAAAGAIQVTSDELEVKINGSTLSKDASGIKVAALGVTASEIAANAVSAAKLNSDVAGSALSLNGTTNALDVNVAAAGGIEVATDALQIKLDAATLALSSSGLKVASSGISATEIAANAVSAVKLNADVAGSGLVLNGTTNAIDMNLDAAGALVIASDALKVQVDASTAKINASNQIEVLKPYGEIKTLIAGDITAQYVDLTHTAYNAASISLVPAGALEQVQGIDFTVSLAGGTAGVTRISFAGDLAAAGASALVAGDILVIKYYYL